MEPLESSVEIVLYRGTYGLDDGIGKLERFHLAPAATNFVKDWSIDLDGCPMGIRYISEPGRDKGRLIVGDAHGHVYVFNALNDASNPASFVSRSPALLGAVGADGFNYEVDPLEPDDRWLVFSSACATYKATFNQ